MKFQTILFGLVATQIVAGYKPITNVIRHVEARAERENPDEGRHLANVEKKLTKKRSSSVDIGQADRAMINENLLQLSRLIAESNEFPVIKSGGMVTMTLLTSKNEAGPFKCMIESTGTGSGEWTEMEVTTNADADNSLNDAFKIVSLEGEGV